MSNKVITDLTEKLAAAIYETETMMAVIERTASPFYVRNGEHSNLCEIVEYKNQSLGVRATYYERAQMALKGWEGRTVTKA